MKTKTKTIKNDNFDIKFVFKNVKLNVVVDSEIFNEEQLKQLNYAVKVLSKEIHIDKSYVDFPENKHNDTFLANEGWNQLCKICKMSNFGENATRREADILDDSFMSMILSYMYQTLEQIGFDIENVFLEFEDKVSFTTEFYIDDVQEWKYYPGPWQDWGLKENNEQK